MSDMPVLQLPDKPNFMVVNGETFYVEKIEKSPEQMLGSLHAYYQAHLEELKNRVKHHFLTENRNDLEQQVARIERHHNRSVITVPDHLKREGTILYLGNKCVYETRVMLFRPTRLSVTAQRVSDWILWINRDMPKRESERFSKFIEWATPLVQHLTTTPRGLAGTKVDITVEQDLFIKACVASYVSKDRQIRLHPLNFHPHAYSDGRLCTGNTPAEVFWNDSGFESNFNSLNPHSFANSSTPSAQEHRLLLKNTYFVRGEVREEGGSWTVA